jgi:hypothetical protein
MTTTRRRRIARKLILLTFALGPMIAMMGYDAAHRAPYHPPTAAAPLGR